MNYEICANGKSFTIGTQKFGTTKLNLVEITCLETEKDFSELFKQGMNNKFVIFKNGVPVEKPVPIISHLIQYKIDGIPTDNILLNQDLGI